MCKYLTLTLRSSGKVRQRRKKGISLNKIFSCDTVMTHFTHKQKQKPWTYIDIIKTDTAKLIKT